MAWQVIEKSPRISLLARKRAEELGVDITTVTGAGAEGSITVQDIESRPRKPKHRLPQRLWLLQRKVWIL